MVIMPPKAEKIILIEHEKEKIIVGWMMLSEISTEEISSKKGASIACSLAF